MSKDFDPQKFEKKWIEKWEEEKVYAAGNPSKERKMYTLVMFPYPSGAGLHTGHARVYTGTDVLARFYRMNGYQVLHPMGWDGFGLPAENAAIKEKKNPREVTESNIATFKRQMKMLGFSYDWEKEINTTDPEYYAITQWLFIQFFKHGLLYKKDTPVYYCDFCKTGLAQEEVMADGTHERCGNVVTKKKLPQWIFKITTYAESLLQGLEGLDWPNGILEMQKNWIGRREGINITYDVVQIDDRGRWVARSEGSPNGADPDSSRGSTGWEGERDRPQQPVDTITCFTTRPDTNFGATFIVIAPEHKFAQKILQKKIKIQDEAQYQSIETYIKSSLQKTERERLSEGGKKTGVFTGFYAINHLNNRLMPVWISDFVLADVGTAAVVGVPGHDMRDFEFAKAHNIDILRVVVGSDRDISPIIRKEQIQEEEGTMINSGFLDNMDIHKATKEIMNYLVQKGWGEMVITYHLRDWIFSRQRYWGEPIPMVFCKKCAGDKISYWDKHEVETYDLHVSGRDQSTRTIYKNSSDLIKDIKETMYGWFPLSDKDLPLKLPEVQSYEPNQSGESPLVQMRDWVKTSCPHCGGEARRETDTMPNWAGSCWYFFAFAMNQVPSSKSQTSSLDQISPPAGGLKSQISNSSWLPVDWYIGGAEHAVLHLLYARFWMHALHDMKLIPFREPFRALRNVGMVQAEDGRKMSKSWGNVINPDDIVEKFGADTLRVYEMFMAPFSLEVAWSTQTLRGSSRFIQRIWQIYSDSAKIAKPGESYNKKTIAELQKVILKITVDTPNVKFNTSIAALMEFLNIWEKNEEKLPKNHARDFLKLLAPFAPFITEEIWQSIFDETTSIHTSAWPKADAQLITQEQLYIPVQVNGKVRDMIIVHENEIDEKRVLEKALKSEKIQRWIKDQKYKIIYIKGKILNLVTA